MQDIYYYILEQNVLCDCHTHLFGKDHIIKYPKEMNTVLSFVNNPLKYPEDNLLPYFKEFIKEHPVTCNHLYISGIGKDKEETDKILTELSDHISCIGEVKCFKHYRDSEDMERTFYDTTLLEHVVQHYTLPVFVHWDLNGEHDDELFNIIKNNPQIKFVLCHCGINELDCPHQAFNKAVELQSKLPNLWLDISWVALDYMIDNPEQLSKIPVYKHVLLGTDYSEIDKQNDSFDSIYRKFFQLNKKINPLQSLKELFI